MKYLLNSIFLLFSVCSLAQTNVVAYSRDYEFKEGIFLTLEQFKNNAPILKSAIVSAIPKNQMDFMDQVVEQKIIVYKDSAGKEQKIEVATVWGYCQNRTIYINFNKEFNRINVIGSLCNFAASVRVAPVYRDPMDYNYGINNAYDEMKQFVYDTQTNLVHDFNAKNMELVLKNDEELYTQFMALKKRAKEDAVFIYLRKYNEKHPLYLSSN